jgi:hypothetical protein
MVIILLKLTSIINIMRDDINVAISTTMALLCSSGHVGQLTLFVSSSFVSSMYVLNLLIFHFFISARVERLELPANGFGDRYSTN